MSIKRSLFGATNAYAERCAAELEGLAQAIRAGEVQASTAVVILDDRHGGDCNDDRVVLQVLGQRIRTSEVLGLLCHAQHVEVLSRYAPVVDPESDPT